MHYIMVKIRVQPLTLPHEISQASLPARTFQLQDLDAFEEEDVAVELAGALNIEDEVVAYPTELHLALEFLVSQTFSADGVVEGVTDDSLHFTFVTLVSASFLRRLLTGDGLKPDDAAREALSKLLRIVADDGTLNLDIRKETVGGGADRGELGVVGSDALDAMEFHTDLLAGPKLSDQNIRVNGLNGVIAGEELLLATDRVEGNVLSVDVGVPVQLAGIVFVFGGVGVLGTLDIESQNDSVVVAGSAAALGVIIGGFLEPAHPIDALYGALEGDKTQSLREDLILDDGGVVVDKNVFDCKSGNLRHENPTESICDCCVKAHEGEGGFERGIPVELDFEIL